MLSAVTPEQFQEYYQQWTQPIVVEEGDLEAQHQRKLNAAYRVAHWTARRGEAMKILEQVIEEQDRIFSNNNHDNTGKHRFLLALCHWFVNRNDQQRDELFRQAVPRLEIEAQRGGNDDNHKSAAYSLAECLCAGKGVDKDMRRAIHWYKIAAELGHDSAQTILTERRRTEPTVFDWWKQMAVENEHAWAQHALGRCYETGEGVEKDLVKAVEWYNKAIAQGCQKAKVFKDHLLNNDLSAEECDETLGGVERNQKIEKAKVLIHQQPVGSVPLGLWAFVLGLFQNPIHHPCESPSPTFVALCEGIMPQFKKES